MHNSTIVIHGCATVALFLFMTSCNKKESPRDTKEPNISNAIIATESLEYRDGDFLWRPSEIKLELVGKEVWQGKQFLSATNTNKVDDCGWDSILIELPVAWIVKSFSFDELSIDIQKDDGTIFKLPHLDIPKVGFNVHSTEKTEIELVELWKNHKIK